MIYTLSLQRDYDTHSLMFIIMRLQTVRYVQTCGEWRTGHGVQGYDTVGYDDQCTNVVCALICNKEDDGS